MNKQEFFEKICSSFDSQEEKIVALLIARGFFIDYDQNGYYLSDNAAVEDIEYLSYGMRKYSLGSVFDCDYIVHSNGHKVIRNKTARISIDKQASIKNAISFFEDSGQISYEVCFQDRKWSEFIFRDYGIKIPVKNLEPYVSLYVKAVSACGVLTNYSCDGNHKSDGKIIVGADYPYNIWHEQICKKCFSYSGMIYKGIAFTKETQYKVYYDIFLIASWLYQNRYLLRDIKRMACKEIGITEIRHCKTDELEELFLSACNFASIEKMELLK